MAIDAANNDLASTSRSASWRAFGVIFLSRFALNLQFRIVYPFLPAISRGLGVPLETASLLLVARALVGATSPLYGALADRHGRRALMLTGLVALVAGSLLVAVAPAFGVMLAAFALLGLCKASYDPAMQALVGDALPYEQRGRVLSLLELPWALAWLIGVPATGFLIAAFGWQSPFWLIAALGSASVLLTLWIIPPSRRGDAHGPPAARSAPQSADRSLTPVRLSLPRWVTWPVIMALTVTFLLMLAIENVFVVYGAWLENQFGLSVTVLGVASIVISLAELTAEGGAAALVDRLGKRRAVLGGLLLTIAAYVVLPLVAGTLAGALGGVTLMFLAFEFSIVCMVPLVSELAPEARGTVLAFNVAAMAAARAVSALTAPRLWAIGGLTLNASVSAAAAIVAALIMWRGIKERRQSTS